MYDSVCDRSVAPAGIRERTTLKEYFQQRRFHHDASQPFLALACTSLIAFIFGLVLCFGGYRFFLFLLPIWGFFFGLLFGAQTMQMLFGEGFLVHRHELGGRLCDWRGLCRVRLFLLLHRRGHHRRFARLWGGRGVDDGHWLCHGADLWIIGMVAGVALAIVTLMFNLQKWVIIIATSVMGAGVIFGSFLLLFNPQAEVIANPVKTALAQSPLLMIVTLGVAVFGIIVQLRASRAHKLASYNRWTEIDGRANLADSRFEKPTRRRVGGKMHKGKLSSSPTRDGFEKLTTKDKKHHEGAQRKAGGNSSALCTLRLCVSVVSPF